MWVLNGGRYTRTRLFPWSATYMFPSPSNAIAEGTDRLRALTPPEFPLPVVKSGWPKTVSATVSPLTGLSYSRTRLFVTNSATYRLPPESIAIRRGSQRLEASIAPPELHPVVVKSGCP